MGIVNATPDSFSDGGKHFEPGPAIDRAVQMAAAGVSIIDVGGESTRPYSQPVEESEELRRVIPVIEGIVSQCSVPVSVDTSKAKVAQAALRAGAEIVNDVTGLEGDPDMLEVVTTFQPGVCAMHMQGTPQTMQDDPSYADVVNDILEYLKERQRFLVANGVQEDRICLDPGIGFGKTHQHNLELLRHCEAFTGLASPVLIGHSRKGFVGKLQGDKEAERDSSTLALSLMMSQKGIHIVRVHAAEATVRALRTMALLRESRTQLD